MYICVCLHACVYVVGCIWIQCIYVRVDAIGQPQILFPRISLHECVWVCVCVHSHILMWAWTCHSTLAEVRGQPWVSILSFHLIWGTVSLSFFFHHVHQATSSRNFQVMYTRLPLLPLLIISRALLSLPHISSYEYLYTCALSWVFMVVFQDWPSGPHTCTVKLHPQTLLSSPTLVLEAGSLTAV